MIYFVKHVESGHIKIGTSRNYRARFNSLTAQYGIIHEIGVMPGHRKEEQRLHTKYKKLAVEDGKGREWFYPTSDLIDFILSNTVSSTYFDADKDDMRLYQGVVVNHLLDLMTAKQLREGRFITIDVVANESGVSRPTVASWLKNTRQVRYDFSIIEKFCNYFKCDVGDLLTLDEIDEEEVAS